VPPTDGVGAGGAESSGMYARAVDDAAVQLRSLRTQQWEDFALAGMSFAVALAATRLEPALVMPFFVGALFATARGMHAVIRHFELLDALTGEPEAYVIAEVRARAFREATLERRRTLASYLRAWASDERLSAVADELRLLVAELENEQLELSAVCAVECARLLSGGQSSPLFDPARPVEEVRARVRHIRAGFTPRSAVGASAPAPPRAGNPQDAQRHRRFPWRLRGGTFG
jgi:hypothetical protein